MIQKVVHEDQRKTRNNFRTIQFNWPRKMVINVV